jgi:2-methylcitrate dehydratase PrpD
LSKVGTDMTTVERIASWAAGLQLADAPGRISELLRVQRLSVLGALGASARDGATRRVLLGLGRDRKLFSKEEAEASVYAGAVMSIALDYDDYMCFGHTGHTSVLVPLFFSAETRASGTRQLEAQLAANEIGARLGGACLLGPLNGQLWSFIHCAEAALAAGLLLELDEKRLAHALAISLYQPPRPSVPGFMAPDSKLLTAAEPAAAGVRAARLASAGVTGPLDVLDHPKGFFRSFSYAPIRGMLGGLGTGWATDTLCVKTYPGCAYVDPVLDAVLDLGPPKAEEIERIVVRAGALTYGMDALSAEYAVNGELSPVTINFSVAINVAIAVAGGRLTPEELNTSWIEEHSPVISDLRRRVELIHDWDLTRAGSAGFGAVVPTRSILKEVGGRRLSRGLRWMRSDHRGVALRLGDSIDIVRWVRDQKSRATASAAGFWDDAALTKFRMTLPASIEIELRDGATLHSDVEIPTGAAGHPSLGPARAAEEKFARWGPELWGKDSDAIRASVRGDAGDLVDLVTRATLPS